MKRETLPLLVLCVALLSAPAFAQPDKARQAAALILSDLSGQKYKLAWDQHVSGWFKKQVTEDVFLANMSMGRPALGKLSKSYVISNDHSTRDPASGYQGDIYAVTFRNTYTAGDFFEKIVVLKDPDGVYRMAGIFGSQVPK